MNNKIYLADLTHTGSGLMALTFPLGTSYVAGYSNKVLSNEFDFKLFKLPEDLIKAISKESPLVLALSNYSWNIELGYKVIEWAKDLNPNLITVFGGPNFPTESSEKQDFLKFRSMVDFYIESEGEVGFVDLLRKLKEYDFNFKAIKRAQEKIINCTYLGENCLIEATIQRITDVNMLPSPYLNGSMDEFFKLPLIPMIETNRGCPFSCTFCADGLKYKNKVYSYDTSRVREELHYIYENVKKNGFKMDELRISDLNFGMYREDKETAGYIAELQSNYGWPKLVRGSLGKNRHDRIMDMLGLLKGTFPMGAALQSTDETVLKNIKRSNISVESYKKVMEFMNKTDKKSKTFSELILGLPGDSKKTHFQSLKTVIENKVNTIRQFQAILLSGTEMANPQTRDKFKLLTKHRIMTGAVGKYKFGDDEVPITEIEEIIVGSKDMSFDDYVTCRKMLLIIETFHNNALFEEFFLALEKLGISEWECLVYILNHDEIYTSKIKEIMLSYVNSTKYGLYETYEQAKTHSVRPGRYEKHLSGEIGSRELVEHKGLLYNEMDDLVKIMVKVSNKFMIHYGTDVHQDSRDYFEQLGDYIICAKGNIVDTDLEYDWEFNYHWTDIGKLNFEIDPRKIKRYKENLSFKFFHNKDQKDRIKNAIALHPNHPTAAPMLYNQNMKMLYRLPEIVPDKQFYQDTETMNNINKEKLKSTMISLFYDPTRWDDRKGKEIMDIIDDEGAISKEKTDFMVVPSTFMFLSSNGTVITCHSNIETQEEQELRNSASSMEHTGIALWTLWKYIRDNPDEDEEKIKELFKVQKSHGNGCECSTICTATFEDIIGSPKLFGELSMDEVVNIISNQQKFMSGHQIVGNFINITRASRIVYEKNDSSRILAIDSYALTDTQIDFFLKFIIANKISPENLYILDRDKSGTLSKQLGLNEREVNHCNRYPLKQPVGLLAY